MAPTERRIPLGQHLRCIVLVLVASCYWSGTSIDLGADDSAATNTESHSASVTSDCGCRWTEQHGCTVTDEQALAGMSTSIVSDMCQETNKKGDRRPGQTSRDIFDPQKAYSRTRLECILRQRLHDNQPNFQQCLSLDEEECQEQRAFCKHDPQRGRPCSIDMAMLVKRILSNDKVGNRLMKLVLKADACGSMTADECTADTYCEYSEKEGCGLSKKYVYYSIMESPKLLGMFIVIASGSDCRAIYEHGTGKCPSQCQMEYGVCTIDPRIANTAAPTRLVDILCSHSYKIDGKCPSPCAMLGKEREMPGHEGMAPCRSADSPSTEDKLSDQDLEVVISFSIVHSGLVGYERHCNLRPQEACTNLEPVCDGLNETWTLHGGKGGQARDNPAPGLVGILGEIAANAADSTSAMGQLFDEYLQDNPADIKYLLVAASSHSHHMNDMDPGDPDEGFRGHHGHRGGFGGGGRGGGDVGTQPWVTPLPPNTLIVNDSTGSKKYWIAFSGLITAASALYASAKVWPVWPFADVFKLFTQAASSRGGQASAQRQELAALQSSGSSRSLSGGMGLDI
mmetsp:Transcript_44977/g.106830  ORF Transcript_44977/g.106830 Transcript_44977/m.106830 type:complete len:568 (-) Transcript_44977:116-1819(-)